MPFVKREHGKIVGIFARAQEEGQEYVEENSLEIDAFRERVWKDTQITAEQAKVNQDSIELIRKYIIEKSDCPRELADLEVEAETLKANREAR